MSLFLNFSPFNFYFFFSSNGFIFFLLCSSFSLSLLETFHLPLLSLTHSCDHSSLQRKRRKERERNSLRGRERERVTFLLKSYIFLHLSRHCTSHVFQYFCFSLSLSLSLTLNILLLPFDKQVLHHKSCEIFLSLYSFLTEFYREREIEKEGVKERERKRVSPPFSCKSKMY